MSLQTDPQILAEHNAREERAMSGIQRSPEQLACVHRDAAEREHHALINLLAHRAALPSGDTLMWDWLTREIAKSQAFIEARLAKAEELEAMTGGIKMAAE